MGPQGRSGWVRKISPPPPTPQVSGRYVLYLADGCRSEQTTLCSIPEDGRYVIPSGDKFLGAFAEKKFEKNSCFIYSSNNAKQIASLGVSSKW